MIFYFHGQSTFSQPFGTESVDNFLPSSSLTMLSINNSELYTTSRGDEQ